MLEIWTGKGGHRELERRTRGVGGQEETVGVLLNWEMGSKETMGWKRETGRQTDRLRPKYTGNYFFQAQKDCFFNCRNVLEPKEAEAFSR